jgi:N-sulfoglucosamine sulfohydrolase
MTNSIRFLTSLLLISTFSFLQTAEKNIIFIITDDQSPTLGCYGDQVAVTPAIDKIAADGTVFLNAFATTASCAASRSVVMSGLHNHKNGMYGHAHHFHKFTSFHDVIALSLPRALSNNGYRTVQIGKYHVAPEEVYHFDTYLKANSRSPVEMADKVEAIIKEKSDKPFFLYFATSDPHRGGGKDMTSPLKHKPDLFGNKKEKGAYPGIDEVFYDSAKVPVPKFLPDTPESRSELAQYYQSISRVDQGVARLVEILKEAGLYDKTLIVFTADHGMAFPGGKTTVFEGGLKVPFVVRNPYEPKRGVVSKAMISHVDITPSLVDFADALDTKHNRPKKWQDPKTYWKDKDYASKENRSGKHKFNRYHGRSWVSILSKTDHPEWGEILASHTFHEIQMYYPMRVFRDRQFKLIWNIAHGLPYPFASDLWAASTWQAQLEKGKNAPYGQKTVDEYINRPPFELYAIDKDPHESKNLADNPEYADILDKYKGLLKQKQKELNDPWITKWDYE